MEEKAIVLLSGGLDSSLCLDIACSIFDKNVVALSIYYGQRHAVEVTAARKVASHYRVKHRELHLPASVFCESKGALTNNDVEVPEVTYRELIEKNELSPLYVPFRNGVLLSLATAIALQEDATLVYYGAHAEDNATWAYPDCSPEFGRSMNSAMYYGTGKQVSLRAPLQGYTKKEIVEQALMRSMPLHLTYSCYKGGLKACGKCPTCVSRIEAFKDNGAKDPIEYEIPIQW